MKVQIKDLSELKESRILFDKNPPAFGYVFILVISVFLVAALIWSIKTPKIYTIEAQGIVTNTASNYVMCVYTGEIDICNLEEGKIVETGDILLTIKSTDYNLQEEQLLESRLAYEKQITQYKLLVESIKDNVNYFDESDSEDELYYSTYEAYKSQVVQNTLDTSAYANYYSEEQIEAELKKNQGKLAEIYYSAIQSAENSIAEAEQQISYIDAQLVAIESGQEEYTVKATASGVIHLLGDYKSGMVVQTTTTVATITPENSDRMIEAYVSTADMARMHEGDDVQIVIDGLSQSVYGTISGTVEQIDSNVTAQENGNNGTTQVFRVFISMDADYLVSRIGDKVNISNGMTAVSRIRYDKVSYFNYVLEKIGFKSR